MAPRSPAHQPFIVIGAFKAGTTSLHRVLSQHPEIGTHPQKELDYFSERHRSSREDYLRLFHRRNEPIRGEASPSYASYPKYGDVAARIAQAVPDARLVYCLREPVDRMRAQYRHEVLRSREVRPGFEALDDPEYLYPSLYGMQLDQYMRHFQPEQIAIISLDELQRDPSTAFRRLFSFLGADPDGVALDHFEAVFVSDERPALTHEIERLRRQRLVRTALVRVPEHLKQRAGFHLPGVEQATARARGLMAGAAEWSPPEQTRRWLLEDAALLRRAAADCVTIGDLPEPSFPPPRRPVEARSRAAHRLRTRSRSPKPLTISVAMPLYQPSRRHLAAALDSLRAQTARPVEVVITDDSPRTNAALVDELGRDLDLRYTWNAHRLGMVENWNMAIKETHGTHVVLLHQDDALEPSALELLGGVFERDPEVAICGCAEIRVDSKGFPLCAQSRPNHRERLFLTRGEHPLDAEELTYLMVRNGQVFGEPSALMMDREHFDAVGGFDPTFRQSVDIDLTIRMAQSGTAVYLNERLVRRRVHPQQATQENIVEGRNLQDRRQLFERYVAGSRFSPDREARMKANLVVRAGFDGLRALRHRRWRVAREATSQIIEYRPPIPVLAGRMAELLVWTNHDAR